MEITYTHAAGLDVHKKTVVACCLTPGLKGKPQKEIRTFGTTTQDLLALADWLTNKGITHVAMESTGEFWKPVYNILEANFTILVVNAQHIRNVPGRKTDVKDAEWITDLLRHGLLRGSFIPPLPQRDLRDLTRQRTNLVQDRARVVNQLQKVLEWANLKLASVVSDIMGVSARAMLAAIVGGEGDQGVLAALAQGRLRTKQAELERALEGHLRPHHRFMLAQHLMHIDFLEEQIASFDRQIATYIEVQTPPVTSSASDSPPPTAAPSTDEADWAAVPLTTAVPWAEAVTLLDTAPGIGRTVAEMIIAEVGTDMRRFPSEAHLSSWAKVSPGNHESGGKRYTGKTGRGSRWIRSALVQAAHAAVRTKDSHLAAVYRRLVVRRGHKKAIMAVAHRLLVAIYYMLKHREPYREVGAAPRSNHAKRRLVERMQRRIEQLGYTVKLEAVTPPAAQAA
ncbi:MAG TPA: IS110 family transposase [Chloroflexota bacterium]|nr:IS110 family transposase [Chloroflexota bacterium]